MSAGVLLLILAEVAVLAGLVVRWRLRRLRQSSRGLSQDDIRRIEEQGSVELDEGLDQEEIDREEERFWSQYWDEPDEF